MGKVTVVKGFSGLRKALVRDFRAKEKALDQARARAAKLHADYLRKNIPVAFGELRASVHVEGTRIVVDAPHAAAVERGSRPHWVPLDALLKWVELRGFQSLASPKSLERLPGTTTARHARSIGADIASHGDSSFEDSTLAVAKAIQISIALNGTKPHWYMRDSVPVAQGFVRVEMHKALTKGG